jgi:hypothetical protein
MSKLEMAIRNGNFTTEDVKIDGIRTGEKVYIVTVEGSRFPYKERISEDWYNDIIRRIKKGEERRARIANHLWTEPANVEHTACMSDIMAAYDDYRAAIAY